MLSIVCPGIQGFFRTKFAIQRFYTLSTKFGINGFMIKSSKSANNKFLCRPRKDREGPSCLVLSPTRELAQQIEFEVKKLQVFIMLRL